LRDAQRLNTPRPGTHVDDPDPRVRVAALTRPKLTLGQALTDKRMLAILLMSFASGLPFNLTSFTTQAWLASSGLNVKTIGLFTLVGLPYSFKFIWSPLLDRFYPPVLTRRRGWIAIFQGTLALVIAGMGFCSPTENLSALAGCALLVAILSASQDIVIDAYRVDTIPPSERGLAASASALGYRTAAAIGGSVLVLIAARFGWRLAYIGVALLMAAMMFSTVWTDEPARPHHPPRRLAEAIWLPLLDLLKQPGIWGFLALAFLYKFGDAFALSLYSTFMIKGMGFSLDQLSIAGKINMTISAIVGTSIGGWAFLRWGMFRALLIFGVAQALSNLMYMWLALAGKKLWLMALATTVDTMIGGMGLAAFTAFLMSLCNVNFSAVQYAMLSALATIPSKVTGAIAGAVVNSIGWANFFVLTCLTATPGLLMLLAMRGPLAALNNRDATRD
jgi:PAT family beta-lactamase induction signal transducer AmpG